MVSPSGGCLSVLLRASLAALLAAVLTGVARRFALSRAWLDVPNERSSHTVPTPRGGGLAIVVVVLVGDALLGLAGRLPARTTMALLGGVLVAAVGWADDRHGLSAKTRLVMHFAAALWALLWLDGMPSLIIGRHTAGLGLFGSLLAAVAIVWATNITNFMDGIDGLAGTEAAAVSLTAATLLAEVDPGLAAAAAMTGGAALGFLIWNWQPARIFMGDVGSGFLGFNLAVLGVASERQGTLPVAIWILLYLVFAVDGTATILRRGVRGERWYAAHRSHAYQRAVQAGWSHGRVTLVVLGLDVALGVLARWTVADYGRLGLALLVGLAVCGAAYGAIEWLRPMVSDGPVGAHSRSD